MGFQRTQGFLVHSFCLLCVLAPLVIGNQCLSPFNNTILEGDVIITGSNSTVKSYAECCRVCATTPTCNCFMYCDNKEGCVEARDNSNSPHGSCTLIFQAGLEEPGSALETKKLPTSSAAKSWLAGAPVSPGLSVSPPEYDLFAFATVSELMQVKGCSTVDDKDRCYSEGSLQDVADACAQLPACMGFVFSSNATTSYLIGGSTYARFLLQLRSSLSVSPSSGIFVKGQSLPSNISFIQEGVFLPPLNMSSTVDTQSGCVIEPNTNYVGSLVASISTESALQCCEQCEASLECNQWTFCPNPRNCNHPLGYYQISYKQCDLRYQSQIGAGNYPFMYEQGDTVTQTSGLPPKVWRVLQQRLSGLSRPNGRMPGSTGCQIQKNSVYGGIELENGASNKVDSLESCCKSCGNNPQCNVFVYCNRTDGCLDTFKGIKVFSGHCTLKYQAPVSMVSAKPRVIGEGIELEEQFGRGENITFVSGAPIRLSQLDVDGYDFTGYGELQGVLDFECPGRVVYENAWVGPYCRIASENLTAKMAAETCDSLPLCRGFAFLPYGEGNSNRSWTPVAYLKGNVSTGEWQQALQNQFAENPSIAFYSESTENQSTGGSDVPIAAIVVPIVIVALIAITITTLIAVRYSRRKKQVKKEALQDKGTQDGSDPKFYLVKLTDNASSASTPSANSNPPSTDRDTRGPPLWSDCTTSTSTAPANHYRPSGNRGPPLWSDYTSILESTTTATAIAANEASANRGPPLWSDYQDSVKSTRILQSHSDHATKEVAGEAANHNQSSAIDAHDILVYVNGDGQRQIIGEGASSVIIRGEWKGLPVALKQMKRSENHRLCLVELMKEISVIQQCSHENIVKLHGIAVAAADPMLVFELMEGGDLFAAIRKDKKLHSWYNKGQAIVVQVARGLSYLHAQRIIHCDMKSMNVLLTADGTAKIGDMGMAKFMMHELVTRGNTLGTFAYAAPELLLNSKVTSKVDVYSFGVILWEIVTGEQPKRGDLRKPSVPEECPESVKSVIEACLMPNPDNRPTASALLTMLEEC